MLRRPPISTRTDTLLPYTTPFRSVVADFRYLIKTRACLPGLAPELFVFELGEFRINVAADADTVRHRLPARWPAVAAARRVLRGCVLCQIVHCPSSISGSDAGKLSSASPDVTGPRRPVIAIDRKSTRLNSSH